MKTLLRWTSLVVILVTTTAQGSEVTDKPDCRVTLTAYNIPVPYIDRQIVPMIIMDTAGRQCPVPEIQTGTLFYLDTPSDWLAGIGMRIQAHVHRSASKDSEGPGALVWSHLADSRGKAYGASHPLKEGSVFGWFDKP